MLNYVLFGMTAKEFKDKYPELAKQGKNMRDCASTTELVVLKNLESANATLIRERIPQQERFTKLTIQCREEMKSIGKSVEKRKSLQRNNLGHTTYEIKPIRKPDKLPR